MLIPIIIKITIKKQKQKYIDKKSANADQFFKFIFVIYIEILLDCSHQLTKKKKIVVQTILD